MELRIDMMLVLMIHRLLWCILNPIDIFIYGIIMLPSSEALTTNIYCQTNNDCFHGVCDRGTNTCSCIDNWVGQRCNIKVTDGGTVGTQSLDTKLAETDSIHEIVTDIPKQIEKQSGYLQDKHFRLFNHMKHKTKTLEHDYLSNANSKISNGIKRNVDVAAIETEEHDVCIDDSKRSLKERMCLPGLICSFGTCSQNHRGSHIVFECSCDKGAIGLFCDHKCCLDCGQHGRCSLMANGTEYCDCRFNFHGDRCELHILDSLVGPAHDDTAKPHRRLPLLIIIALSVVTVLLLLAVVSLLLILRQRCCLAIMTIPSKCSRQHTGTEGDVIVCYHGNERCQSNMGIPESQHRIELSKPESRDEVRASEDKSIKL